MNKLTNKLANEFIDEWIKNEWSEGRKNNEMNWQTENEKWRNGWISKRVNEQINTWRT